MKNNYGMILLVLAALIAIGTGIAHLSCIYFGPECYRIQMAPDFIVESAKAGTYLAPLGAVFISTIFTVIGCYALSGARVLSKLPFLKFGIYTIAFVCIVRGLLGIQLWIRKPELTSDSILYAGMGWFIVGMLYLIGFRAMGKIENQQIVK
jgi:hypothetical protein